MGPRSTRIARNEHWLRRANERIENTSKTLADEGFGRERGEVEFLCECGRRLCPETIAMTVTEYESAHAEPDRYVVVPGHATPALERVVESYGRYEIVEKSPRAEAIGDGGT